MNVNIPRQQISVSPGAVLRNRINTGSVLPLIGVFDQVSASIAASRFEAVFCSGYGFAASYYGLPDEGFIAWPDMVAYVERMRAILPSTHIVVDIDDGYGDPNLAANVVRRLERVGASAVVLEDQRRPKRCGHLPGKEILDEEDYLLRLRRVLAVRGDLVVVARTDAPDFDEGLRRARLYAAEGVDAVMVEGLSGVDDVARVREAIGPDTALTVNLIAGGKTPPVTLTRLQQLGANLVIYSTPCLFAAQTAMETYLDQMKARDGELAPELGGAALADNLRLQGNNLARALKP